MSHFIFHVGPEPGRQRVATAVALAPDLTRTERSGPDLGQALSDVVAAIGDRDWTAFAPTVHALGLDPAREARPGEARAIEMADRALAHLGVGDVWDVESKVKKYAMLRFFADLADSGYFRERGRTFPYLCDFHGTFTGECCVIASSNLRQLSITLLFSDADMRRALEANRTGDRFTAHEYVGLVLEFTTPWWMAFSQELFGTGVVPVVLNMRDEKLYGFDDSTGLALGAVACALSAARPGRDAEAHVCVEEQDFVCRLTRTEL